MTARRQRRQARPSLLAVAAVAAALAFAGVVAVDLLAHVWPVLLAAAALGGYALGQCRRPAPSPRPPSAPAPGLSAMAWRAEAAERRAAAAERQAAEVPALRARLDALAAELAAARESAEMAWDAAAERPPGPARPGRDDLAAALLADPRSGVHPLGVS